MDPIDTIILAGGLGTRLRQAVPDLPKPLAPVNGRPFLDILLRQLAAFAGIRKVVLAIGYKAEVIKTHYQGNHGHRFDLEFCVENVPMGTGGAILQALPFTGSRDVLVMNGDSYIDFDLERLLATHSERAAEVTMVVTEVEDTARFGSIKLDTSSSRVVEFVEKGSGGGRGFINAGCYLLARKVFEREPLQPVSFEKDILPRHLHSTYAQVARGKFIDIGVPESYRFAAEYLG